MNPAALKAALIGDLDNFLAASTPGGIERQEAQGQRDFVASETIPKEVANASVSDLQSLGFVLGRDADELFVNCTLPAGWTKRATEHSMHSDLLDEQGRVRAGIFYKAAFYDRRADMHLKPRFTVDSWEDGTTPEMRRVAIKDSGAVVKAVGEYERRDWEALKALEIEAKKWLSKEHPGWESPMNCWAA